MNLTNRTVTELIRTWEEAKNRETQVVTLNKSFMYKNIRYAIEAELRRRIKLNKVK